MKMHLGALVALAFLLPATARADPPPAAAPPYRPGVSLQPVAIYDAQGNVAGALGGGSVTPAGTSGSQAQAVQGITGGVPVAIQGGNATAVKVDGSSVTQPISAGSLPLPSGASTAAAQTTGNASLASIDGKAPALVSGRVPVDGSAVTQPVSAAALPLPAGAATAGNQATEIASLATIAQRAALFTDVIGLAVAANGTYTGTVRDLGASPAYTRMNVALYSAQNATVTIQACQDAGCGAAFTVATQQIVVNTSVWATVSAPVYTRYMRVIVQYGGTAGNITVSSSFTAN